LAHEQGGGVVLGGEAGSLGEVVLAACGARGWLVAGGPVMAVGQDTETFNRVEWCLAGVRAVWVGPAVPAAVLAARPTEQMHRVPGRMELLAIERPPLAPPHTSHARHHPARCACRWVAPNTPLLHLLQNRWTFQFTI
jgi:hypothetical protein